MFFVFFIFRRTLFVCFLCRFVCLVGLGGWGSGASVWMIVCIDRLADCGSSWEKFIRSMVVHVGCSGFSDLFVLLPPSPVFLELPLCFAADWFIEYPLLSWVVL